MEKSPTGKIVIKTALIATAVILSAAVIGAAIVFLCFPYEGYKFADNLGMDKLALRFAENYEDDGNIDGLVYCIDKADKLLERSGNVSYAKKLVGYTEKFFSYDNANSYISQLDEYYNDESLDIRVRIGLYSYMGHLIEENYKARTVVGGGEENKILFRGEPKEINDILNSDITVMERSYVISALNKQLLLNRSVLVTVDDNGDFVETESYDTVKSAVAKQMASLKDNNSDEMRYLYLMHGLYYFINGIKEYLSESQLSEEWDIFLNKKSYPINEMSLGEAYKQLFNRLDKKGGANEK